METKLEQIAATAVKQRPKSVVREIRTPRSVGTGGGRPPPVTRWAPSNGCPYRNREKKSRNLGGHRVRGCLTDPHRPGALVEGGWRGVRGERAQQQIPEIRRRCVRSSRRHKADH